ncbi:hypothetical protein, partial [Fervidibacter sacchari]
IFYLGSARNRQQSHHCGIETDKRHNDPEFLQWQQSHHCGIETVDLLTQQTKPCEQQSHHCGIETADALSNITRVNLAAIAPLWD